MVAYTISKLLTTKGVNPNVPQVLNPFNYTPAIDAAKELLERGEKAKAVKAFKEGLADSKATETHLRRVLTDGLRSELTMAV